jgi:hypothetical protein
MARFRILPVAITAAVLLVTLKIGDVWQGSVLGPRRRPCR